MTKMILRIDYGPKGPNDQQKKFHASGADEVVYGGAKGGGKTHALVMDDAAYALQFPGSVSYLFRETYDDLEANLIDKWIEKIPPELYTYKADKHIATLINGSRVYFRYIRNLDDAGKYQGRSIDYIGVDELTKHEEKAVQILLSCLRSPKGFPPRFRATCNPGGKGHAWVKKRYIEGTDYGERPYIDSETGNAIHFIPASVYDNYVIMENDPAYVRRLENLPDDEKKAFLYGDWDIFEGQYFNEFDRRIHVMDPFPIPPEWRRYRVFDYGLDMLACYWIAVDTHGWAFVYKELYEGGLIVSAAAKRILQLTAEDETIFQTLAPPDLWGRQSATGESTADLMSNEGLYLSQADNERVMGWYRLKEWLQPVTDEQGNQAARLRIFKTCPNLIRTLPLIQHDRVNVEDVATDPHELTHAPDAIRYFVSGRPLPTAVHEKPKNRIWQLETDEPRGNGVMDW